MKQAQPTMLPPTGVSTGVERNSRESWRTLSTGALLVLAGCSSRESKVPGPSDTSPQAPRSVSALVVPPARVASPSSAPEKVQSLTLSARERRIQDLTHTRPSDLALKEAYRTTRGLIDDAVRDTQSVERSLGTLRDGYTTHAREIEEQRSIIESVARHSNRSVPEVRRVIEESHARYLDTLGISTSLEHLKQRVGLDEYRRKRAALAESVFEAQEKIAQATVRANLDKIDRSLELFRELRGLLQARDSGAEHDGKRLKGLSRMCSAQTLSEVNEIIPQLELLRARNAEGEFNVTLRQEVERIRSEEERIRALDEAMEQRWCENYDQMCVMQGEIRDLEGKLAEAAGDGKRHIPKELGELVSSDKHVELKADLAEIKLRDSRLAVYSLTDTAGELVAQILDTGRQFNTGEDVRYVRVAIDEPSTMIALRRGSGGMWLEGPAKSSFKREVLDVKETARSEVASAFQPTLLERGTVKDVPLTAKQVLLSLRMNPGCAFDMREVSGGLTLEVTLGGAGIVYVGGAVPGESPVRVKVGWDEAMKGGGPLVISAPEGFTMSDVRYSAESDSNYTISIGNTTFEELGFRREGMGHDVDVEIRTPRGLERVAVVRDGSLLPRAP